MIINNYNRECNYIVERNCTQRIRLDLSPEYCYIVFGHCNIYAYVDPITDKVLFFDYYYPNNYQKIDNIKVINMY